MIFSTSKTEKGDLRPGIPDNLKSPQWMQRYMKCYRLSREKYQIIHLYEKIQNAVNAIFSPLPDFNASLHAVITLELWVFQLRLLTNTIPNSLN